MANVERFFLVVDPDALDHALIEGCRRQTRHVLGFAGRDRIGDSDVIAAARQYRRAELGRKRDEVIKFNAVEVWQPLVPVIRVLLDYPDLVLDIADCAERAGAGVDGQLAQVVVVVLQGLLADDHVPAAGERQHDESLRARLG